jgi:putative endonuclease
MYFVYILYSMSFDKTYVGFTSDVQGRLLAHNHPKNKGYTKRYQPWEILHSEIYKTKSEAMRRESWYKTGIGRKEIDRILRDKGLRKQ